MNIGIDAGGTNLVAALTSTSGRIVHKVSRPVDRNWSAEDISMQPVQLARQAAIGEYWAGAAKGCGPAVVITLGTGTGGGLVANRKLLTVLPIREWKSVT